jgi:alkanesulfonate monooxygenase SsuD/methylene tetrahydromethanopterin reductase-like flavin-dependent oxidoreductase (luciferase family)
LARAATGVRALETVKRFGLTLSVPSTGALGVVPPPPPPVPPPPPPVLGGGTYPASAASSAALQDGCVALGTTSGAVTDAQLSRVATFATWTRSGSAKASFVPSGEKLGPAL